LGAEAKLYRLIARFLQAAILFFASLARAWVREGLVPIKAKTPQERGKTKPDNAQPAEAPLLPSPKHVAPVSPYAKLGLLAL